MTVVVWFVILSGVAVMTIRRIRVFWQWLERQSEPKRNLVIGLILLAVGGLSTALWSLVMWLVTSPLPPPARGALQISAIATPNNNPIFLIPGNRLVFNTYSVNPGPERVFKAFIYSERRLEPTTRDSDAIVQRAFAETMKKAKPAYERGDLPNQGEVGVGNGLWGTTQPTDALTSDQIQAFMKGTLRYYIVSSFAWKDSAEHQQTSYDCRWLQAPSEYLLESAKLVWHACEPFAP